MLHYENVIQMLDMMKAHRENELIKFLSGKQCIVSFTTILHIGSSVCSQAYFNITYTQQNYFACMSCICYDKSVRETQLHLFIAVHALPSNSSVVYFRTNFLS